MFLFSVVASMIRAYQAFLTGALHSLASHTYTLQETHPPWNLQVIPAIPRKSYQ
jgi:hypothetical protein